MKLALHILAILTSHFAVCSIFVVYGLSSNPLTITSVMITFFGLIPGIVGLRRISFLVSFRNDYERIQKFRIERTKLSRMMPFMVLTLICFAVGVLAVFTIDPDSKDSMVAFVSLYSAFFVVTLDWIQYPRMPFMAQKLD